MRKIGNGEEIIELPANYDNQEVTITVSPKEKPLYDTEADRSRLFLSRMIVGKHGGRVVVDDVEGNSKLIEELKAKLREIEEFDADNNSPKTKSILSEESNPKRQVQTKSDDIHRTSQRKLSGISSGQNILTNGG